MGFLCSFLLSLGMSNKFISLDNLLKKNKKERFEINKITNIKIFYRRVENLIRMLS